MRRPLETYACHFPESYEYLVVIVVTCYDASVGRETRGYSGKNVTAGSYSTLVSRGALHHLAVLNMYNLVLNWLYMVMTLLARAPKRILTTTNNDYNNTSTSRFAGEWERATNATKR